MHLYFFNEIYFKDTMACDLDGRLCIEIFLTDFDVDGHVFFSRTYLSYFHKQKSEVKTTTSIEDTDPWYLLYRSNLLDYLSAVFSVFYKVKWRHRHTLLGVMRSLVDNAIGFAELLNHIISSTSLKAFTACFAFVFVVYELSYRTKTVFILIIHQTV